MILLASQATPIAGAAAEAAGSSNGGGNLGTMELWALIISILSLAATIGIAFLTERRMRRWRIEDLAKQREDETPQLDVVMSHSIFRPDGPAYQQVAWDQIAITAANTGKVNVTVGPPVIEIPNGEVLHFFTTEPEFNISTTTAAFPVTLEPGKSVTAGVRCAAIKRALAERSGTVKLTGIYRSQINKQYSSEPFMFNLDADWH